MEEEISTIATSVIALSTVLGIMAAFYYNLLINYTFVRIIFFELLLVIVILMFISYIRGVLKNG